VVNDEHHDSPGESDEDAPQIESSDAMAAKPAEMIPPTMLSTIPRIRS
jgi:hypothetical protein